jgi:riboflavin synthase
MFTGIVSDIGEVISVEPRAQGLVRLTMACSYDPADMQVGASIACNGVCLTVVARGKERERPWFSADAAAETMRMTTARKWRSGTRINLERALKLGDELGGHMATGHVDGLAAVVAREQRAEMAQVTCRIPVELARFVARKGSVALDGVSLTVNDVTHDMFTVLIIPHTLAVTTLGGLFVGDEANFEVDLIARYVGRLLQPE